MKKVVVTVPSSISNLGRGMGQFGLALEIFRIKMMINESNNFDVVINGLEKESIAKLKNLILNIKNELTRGYGLKGNYSILIDEIIPIHYGLGSKEAVAIASCYGLALIENIELTDYEILMIASKCINKEIYWDHLASSYYGGFTFINKYSDPPDLIRIEPPEWLEYLLIVPKTKFINFWDKIYNKLKGKRYSINDIVKESSGIITLIHGLIEGDIDAFIEGLNNELVENIIYENYPYSREVIQCCKREGAIGYMISRNAPTFLFFFNENQVNIDEVYQRIVAFLNDNNYPYTIYKTTWAVGLSSNQ